jgi:serine/threonine protein kinase
VTIAAELLPGTLVDRRYRIQRVLGRGGFGRTYLVVDKWRFGELCVLKEFAPSNRGDAVVTQKLRELFQREATILHKLNHPQIPKFFAVFEENSRLFIVQEYINGKTYWNLLREKHQSGSTFTEPEIVQWLRDLLRVLGYLHQQNIVHRDISPERDVGAGEKVADSDRLWRGEASGKSFPNQCGRGGWVDSGFGFSRQVGVRAL